jgi:hypothetical protein
MGSLQGKVAFLTGASRGINDMARTVRNSGASGNVNC